MRPQLILTAMATALVLITASVTAAGIPSTIPFVGDIPSDIGPATPEKGVSKGKAKAAR